MFNTIALQVIVEMDYGENDPILVDSSESEVEEESGDLRQHLRRRSTSEARFKESRSRRDDFNQRAGSVFSRLGTKEVEV